MGCLRLSYRSGESNLSVSTEEKTYALNWEVWVAGNSEKETKEVEDQQSGGSDWNQLNGTQRISALLNGISENNSIEQDSYLMSYDDVFENYPQSNYGKSTRTRRNVDISKISTEVYVEFQHDVDFQRFNSMHPSMKQVLKGDTYYTNYYFYDSEFTRSMHSKQTLFIQIPSSMDSKFRKALNIR